MALRLQTDRPMLDFLANRPDRGHAAALPRRHAPAALPVAAAFYRGDNMVVMHPAPAQGFRPVAVQTTSPLLRHLLQSSNSHAARATPAGLQQRNVYLC